jgi:tetraacyldisaccharide 4'-kinase
MVSAPVISIGNISTGGTGKTPMTILVASYYLSKGKKVGIISRGYGRISKEMITVFDGKKITAGTEDSGDELLLIAEELMSRHSKNFFVIASADRVKAADHLINHFDPDVIILDDAFQHRKINRDLDIVLIDTYDFVNGGIMTNFTLPSGLLRESYKGLRRSDIIIQNNKNHEFEQLESLREYGRTITVMRYKTEYFIDNKNIILEQNGKSAIVFSGIADDRSFLEMVRSAGINITETIRFPDHHNYTKSDINSMKNRNTGEMIFITTEKDFVKVKEFSGFVHELPVYYLKLEIELANGSGEFYMHLDYLAK